MTNSRRTHLPQLDLVRALAAWWVVGYHTVIRFTPAGALPAMWTGSGNPVLVVLSQGWIAVSVFVMLSGYSLSLGLRGGRISWSRYLGARWLRVAPLYLVVLAVGTLAAAQVPSAGSIFGALTMLPLPDAFTPGPWLATAWSVRIEVVLYLTVPAFVHVLRGRRTRSTLVMVAVLVVVVGAALARTASTMDVVHLGVPGRLVEFGVGFVLGWVGVRIPRRMRAAVVAGAAAGFVAMAYWGNRSGGLLLLPGTTMVTIFVVVLVLGAALLVCVDQQVPPRRTRLLTVASPIGTWSYSTYLWHAVVINLLVAPVLFDRTTGLDPRWALAAGLAATAAVVLPLSWASFHLIEKPFLQLRPRYVRAADGGGPPTVRPTPGPEPATSPVVPHLRPHGVEHGLRDSGHAPAVDAAGGRSGR